MYGVDPEKIFKKSVSVKQRVREMVQNGIDTGVVQPLNRIIFDRDVDKDVLR